MFPLAQIGWFFTSQETLTLCYTRKVSRIHLRLTLSPTHWEFIALLKPKLRRREDRWELISTVPTEQSSILKK